jgi:hypothetical protein
MYEVGESEAMETWHQGTVLIKNPRALHPLPAGWLQTGIEEELTDGKIVTTARETFLPYASMTHTYRGMPRKEFVKLSQALWAELIKVYKE